MFYENYLISDFHTNTVILSLFVYSSKWRRKPSDNLGAYPAFTKNFRFEFSKTDFGLEWNRLNHARRLENSRLLEALEFSKIPKFPLFRNTETLRLSRLTYLGSQRFFFFSRERKLRRRGAKENAERIKKMWLFLHFYLLGIGPLEPGRTDKRHQSIMSAQAVLLTETLSRMIIIPLITIWLLG